MDDIVERLRAAAHSGDFALGQSFDCMAVADEIERLRAKVADLTQRLHWANEEMLRRG